MSQMEQKIVQYLNEAHASEVALVRVLQSQIAMTPPGKYRRGLEKHLEETRDHARRVRERVGQIGEGGNPLQSIVGVAEAVIGQGLALSKTPLDLLRGESAEEKVLKNAKDAAATEALEIATYTSLERLARDAGDDDTARLAVSIRRDEERMLERIVKEIPALTDAVVRAEGGRPARTTRRRRTGGSTRSRSTASRSRRTTTTARRKEPWPGFDDQTVDEVQQRLERGDEERARQVRTYERAHKDRAGVVEAAEKKANGS